jgi:hypothetical protein
MDCPVHCAWPIAPHRLLRPSTGRARSFRTAINSNIPKKLQWATAHGDARSCRRVLVLPTTMLPARRASISESTLGNLRYAKAGRDLSAKAAAYQLADFWATQARSRKLPRRRCRLAILLRCTKGIVPRRNDLIAQAPFRAMNWQTGQKKAQPRGVALRFHQRRRFWRICADTCKDAQRDTIMSSNLPPCKHFLLLCNKYYENQNL